MGNSESQRENRQKKPTHKSKEYSLMVYDDKKDVVTEQYIYKNVQKATIEQFGSLKCGDTEFPSQKYDYELEEGCSFILTIGNSNIEVTKYFQKEEDLQCYVSNSIKLTILSGIKIYEQLQINTQYEPFSCRTIQSIKNFQIISRQYFVTNPQKKLEFLIFLGRLLMKFKNIYIQPSFIAESDNNFILLNFESSENTSEETFFQYIVWLYGSSEDQPFQDISFNHGLDTSIPLYFLEICNRIKHQTFRIGLNFVEEITKIKQKMEILTNKSDSFYACYYFKRIGMFISSSDWIILKKLNEIHFYNISDEHICHGKIIRKKRKIDITSNHLIFDPDELQILYIPENTKLFVRANQFEMEQPTTISDIEIKYKMPLKFKNPLVQMQSNGDILILEQVLYRFNPPSNKIIQETKKINDIIFLTEYKESSYLIIKTSVDIFKNGIRVYYNDEDFILSPTGNQTLLSQIASIRVDIRIVNFCIEIYKGVFLMMASQNIWILDINFGCFFSYGSFSRIKQIYGFSKNSTTKKIDYAFQILNQLFKVDFLPNQDGRNLTITPKRLHILGQISGKPYYLRYKFQPRFGAIQLEGYKPLFVDEKYKKLDSYNGFKLGEVKEYRFNFHEENSSLYKYGKWIFSGSLLLKIYDFTIKWSKTNYEAILQIQPIKKSLKDELQQLKKENITLNKIDTLMILHKVLTMYEYLIKNSIAHKNISVSNIYYTKNREMKLTGWSQPPRNWHVSDYKDYLLTCFNIITYNSVEKFSEKLLKKHEIQLMQYPCLNQKIINCSKHSKTMQKKLEIQKNLQSIKEYLQKELCPEFQSFKGKQFIFCFEYNTPRFNMMNTKTQKIKKMSIVVQDSMAEEFLFHSTDKYQWNQEQGYLYIFTAAFQFYEVKINKEDMSEEKLTLEDYQYLPKNITDSTFIYLHGSGLYSFGGVSKEQNGTSVYCMQIYKFNRKILTWEIIGQLKQARINPAVIVSSCKTKIYLFGGLIDHEFPYFKIISFDFMTNECELLIDKSISNPTHNFDQNSCYKVYHISKKLHLFMLWYMQEGYYVIRYFSCLQSGFDITIKTKNYSADNYLSVCSITIEDNILHILRQYGKYTKINIHKLESATVKSETIYSL